VIPKIIQVFFFTILASYLGGCGGGSSSTDTSHNTTPSPANSNNEQRDSEIIDISNQHSEGQDTSTNPNRPLVKAGRDQYADANVALTLVGVAQAREGVDITHIQWTQRFGQMIEIPRPNELTNIIVTPDVDHLQRFTFELTVTDSTGRLTRDSVNIFVRPLERSVRITSNSVNEYAANVDVRVLLSSAQPMPLTLRYSTQDDSARAGQDYISESGILTFNPGETEKFITIDLLDDNHVEPEEIFHISIAQVENGTVAQSTGTIVIHDGGIPLPRNQSITFGNPGPIRLLMGDSFTNTAQPSSGAQQGSGATRYFSSNETIAQVDSQTGAVTTIDAGQVIITAIKEADSSFQSARTSYILRVAKYSQQLHYTDTGPIEAQVGQTIENPVENTGAGTGLIAYSSNNESVATVDPDTGTVTVLNSGTSIITATKSADDVYAEATSRYTINIPRDNTPDTFNFDSIAEVELNTLVSSNSITISGISTAVPITVSGGQYVIGGGAFTSSAGTVNNGDTVLVRLTSANTPDTTTSAVINIGGVSASFDVTTIAESCILPTGVGADPPALQPQ